MPYLREVPGGVELSVLVQPRASRTKICGEHGGQLKIQLAAPPVDGAANAALVEFVAERVGVPKRQVQLVAGESSRRKRLRIEGAEPARVAAVMNAAP
ncbi:MAG: DUF167 domain-containing protein [Myxococcota bacterium]